MKSRDSVKRTTAPRRSTAPAKPFGLPVALLSTGDPVDNNPYPKNYTEHRVWHEATLRAEEELCSLNSELQKLRPTSIEGFAAWGEEGGPGSITKAFASWTISLCIRKFDIWAKRGIQTVWSESAIRAYDEWLFNYAQAWIDSQWEANCLPESSLLELRSQLMGRMEWWKAEARRYLSEQNAHVARSQRGVTRHQDATNNKLRTEEPRPIFANLNKREKSILEVIQRGLRGLAYCGALDLAGIKCRRTRSWQGCPTTYPAAYKAGQPWRHRIQDEKSKITRKAKLAETHTLLAGE